jgi:fructokinase
MNERIEIVALGEILIDYTPLPDSDAGMAVFEQNPGGAPANVLTCAARLGRRTAFIGKVGDDIPGRFLVKTLRESGIDTRGVRIDSQYFTTLAFVKLSESGERSFSFARKPGADTMLSAEELDQELITGCGILHFGSLSLTDEPARTATMTAVRQAKRSGAIIAYDPNYRPLLWRSREEAMSQMRAPLPLVDLVKVSDDEIGLLADCDDPEQGARQLVAQGVHCVVVTIGSKGALVTTKNGAVMIPGFPVKAVDTTGAGDSFWGGFLTCVSESGKKLPELTFEDYQAYTRFGNAAASLCVQKRGAMPAMPLREDVLRRMEQMKG